MIVKVDGSCEWYDDREGDQSDCVREAYRGIAFALRVGPKPLLDLHFIFQYFRGMERQLEQAVMGPDYDSWIGNRYPKQAKKPGHEEDDDPYWDLV